MPIGIYIKNMKVRSLSLDYNELSWEVADTSEDLLNYSFQVLRSESPMGPFTVISPTFQDRVLFIDNALLVGDKWRKYYYRLRVTHNLTKEWAETTTVVKEPEADLVTLEIRRHEQILFSEHAGRRMWLLPSRQSGQRCTCWAPRLGQRTRSGCTTCFDTGYVRGYYAPIVAYGQIAPAPKATQLSNVGASQQVNTTALFPSFPPLKPDDILVELENRRWKVNTVGGTEKGRATLHQEVTLHEVPPTDIEYSIPINEAEALADLWGSPERNFTNPHHIDAAHDVEVFNLYVKRSQ